MTLTVDQVHLRAELFVVTEPGEVRSRLRFSLASQIHHAVKVAVRDLGAGFVRRRQRSICEG